MQDTAQDLELAQMRTMDIDEIAAKLKIKQESKEVLLDDDTVKPTARKTSVDKQIVAPIT